MYRTSKGSPNEHDALKNVLFLATTLSKAPVIEHVV
jgi:hypothetical protein